MELYDFQREDVKRLEGKRGGAIASEMGTGKTFEAIKLDELWWRKGRKTLVVAPINTWDSWREKYATASPEADVVTIDRKNRNVFTEAIRLGRGDVFLMHWEALRFMPELRQFSFGLVTADEAHRASNRKNQQTLALKKLSTDHKLALSGTLSGDRPENLWSALNWLYPKEFTSYWKFRRRYCVEEVDYSSGHGYTKITGVQHIDELHEILDPFWVRHLKRERCCDHHPNGVMSWLPEITYDRICVDLTPVQRKAYEQMRKEMVAWVGEHEESPLVASVVVAQMVRLSQIALATPTIDAETGRVKLSIPSSKIDAAKELISDHPQKQFVVFSASKQACYIAQQEFAASKPSITSEVLSGDTPQSQRDGMVRRFNDGGFQVFIGVIAAAAEGIDGLQHSTDTAIFLDRSWSTIKNQQAEGRLHRDGQRDTVQIIDIMARNTLDFGRLQRLEEKWTWIKQILGDPGKAQEEVMKLYEAT